MSAVVRLESVSKRFILRHERARSFQDTLVNLFYRRNGSREEFWALRDVSFEVGPGEMLGIIGQNGSGKSTILKLITRILEPTSGKVAVDGKVSALIELGAGFHPDLTGRENIYLNGSILGLSRREMNRKLDDIVAFAELERFIDTPVKHYSSGMYARLGFSVAISVEPDILIVDEVLAVGDEAFQRKCLERIIECKARGVTTLFVSHSLDAVKTLCDRAIWLDAGVIRETGKASQVVDDYLVETNLLDQPPAGQGQAGEHPHAVATTRENRWGNRQVTITRVTLLDGEGRERSWFLPGERFVVRMSYQAGREVSDPVFGIAIYLPNGTQVTGPNTSTSGYAVPRIEGEGWVDYTIDSLPLVPGTYELSVAVYDRTCTHAYDHHHRLYRFEVHRGSVGEDLGLVRIPGRWDHVPARVLSGRWR